MRGVSAVRCRAVFAEIRKHMLLDEFFGAGGPSGIASAIFNRSWETLSHDGRSAVEDGPPDARISNATASLPIGHQDTLSKPVSANIGQ